MVAVIIVVLALIGLGYSVGNTNARYDEQRKRSIEEARRMHK